MNSTALIETIQQLTCPLLEQSLAELGVQVRVNSHGNQLDITLVFGFPYQDLQTLLNQQLHRLLKDWADITIHYEQHIVPHQVQNNVKGMEQVKNIVAVGSGKGGVGKSTTTVNLALALASMGARVAILDADIYGPNQPQMLGVTSEPEALDSKTFKPIVAHGVQSMSIGYLLAEKNAPMVWRGPMVSSALQQLLYQTAWDEVDYLFADLPPGTGDIQLTLSQKIPVSGAAIVTTPQNIALLDAHKAIRMFEKVNIPILGVVENMSLHICSNCGHTEAIFGEGGAEQLSDIYQVNVLGQLPLEKSIREYADGGQPSVVAEPDSEITRAYKTIALKLAANLAKNSKDLMRKFPKIVVE